MDNVTAGIRFLAIVVGQLLGASLVYFVGTSPFIGGVSKRKEEIHKDIDSGLNMIKITAYVVFAALVIGGGLVLFLSKKYGECKHEHIDTLLYVFIGIDLLCLLFIVCQQGGLSHSMFLPVFFLFPAAYLAVVHPSKINTTYYLLGVIGVCIFISFWVSRYRVSHSNFTKLPVLRVMITDFSTLYPTGHSFGLFIISLISIAIPALQLGILKIG